MSLELQVLRTAKAALDEGLVQQQDYDVVKTSFMKALSIKGGVDAGFIGQDDFAEARKEFFAALGMAATGVTPASASPSTPVKVTPVAQKTRSPPRAAASVSPAPATSAPARASAAPPDLKLPESNTSPPPAAATGDANPTTPNIGTPSKISERGGAALVKEKRSMAGISIHPDSINIAWELRVKKLYRWVLFQIADTGKEVVIEKAAPPSSTWAEFVDSLVEDKCRYGVFDYTYVNSEGTAWGKLCFMSWAPDNAPTKAKMQHASTKDLFRGLIEGVSVEVHATDKDDLTEDRVRDLVAQTVAKK